MAVRKVVVVLLIVGLGLGLWPVGVLAEDPATDKWKQSINLKLDEIVKEAERTSNARLMELARQIRETILKVRKIENGGNGGA
jgi:hypothetical protein